MDLIDCLPYMWPLCFIANKFLRMDGEAGEGVEVIGGGDCSLLMGEGNNDDDTKNRSGCEISSNSRLHLVDVSFVLTASLCFTVEYLRFVLKY